MSPAVYPDPTTGEWIGEREERIGNGEIRRQTEWFDSRDQAERFARPGRQG